MSKLCNVSTSQNSKGVVGAKHAITAFQIYCVKRLE
jgi:hypothetical protein